MGHNLPMQVTSFVGRAAELEETSALLARTRMLTLSGAGGSGKTRLALELAATVVDRYSDGAWWVDLAPLAGPDLVVRRVASVLAVPEVATEDLVDTVLERLSERHLLLVLDNCEHLVAACASLADDILRQCPSVVVLATSREPLSVAGETCFRVPSLSYPPTAATAAEDLEDYDSVKLFLDRAEQALPGFRLGRDVAPAVADICRRLDGIPLAIELATARLRALSPSTIARGLSQHLSLLSGGARIALPRHRTLEASIEWSHHLLSGEEQVAYRRLAVFAGSFTAEDAEEVCAPDRHDALDLLARLVDRSLVELVPGSETRYRLLETIRQHAWRRLVEAGEADTIRDRHLARYVAVAERAGPELERGAVAAWLPRLEADIDNLRAAMDWALASGQAGACLRMAAELWLFWLVRGRWREIKRRLEVALSATEADPGMRARALVAGATVCQYSGELRAAGSFAEEAVALARGAHDRTVLGRALCWLGLSRAWTDPPSARPHLAEAIELTRDTGDSIFLARSLLGLGVLEAHISGPSAGRTLLEQSVAVARSTGNAIGAGHALFFLGHDVAALSGRLAEAEQHLEECLEASRRLSDALFTCQALFGLAYVAIWRGRHERARVLLDECLALARHHATRQGEAQARFALGLLAYAGGDLASAASDLELARTTAEGSNETWGLANALWAGGLVSLAGGGAAEARAALQHALELAEVNHYIVPRASSLLGLARLSRRDGDDEQAETLAHEALKAFADAEDPIGVARVLDLMAAMAAAASADEEAARFLGAADALHAEARAVRFAVEAAEWERDLAAARARLGPDRFETAWAEGARLSVPEAVSYARRGRGQRRRPSAGWASLTPAERQVVGLVAQGLTNPQIGERLFVSRRTVQAHLYRVFAKLGVSSRAELAVEATRRGIGEVPTPP